jgi:hypothetical protein
MIIYNAGRATGYELVNPINYDEGRVLSDFDGTSRKEGWRPVHVYRARATKREAFKPADIAFRVSELIMRRSGMEALRDVFEAHGELLPLATDDGVELWICNVLGVIDAHDVERSDLRDIGIPGLYSIYEHVFRPEVIGDREIFRSSAGLRKVYFTDRFVERVKKLKLKGTEFVPLWSSEGPLPKSKGK